MASLGRAGIDETTLAVDDVLQLAAAMEPGSVARVGQRLDRRANRGDDRLDRR